MTGTCLCPNGPSDVRSERLHRAVGPDVTVDYCGECGDVLAATP